jgi:hypothetical protein
MSVKICSSPNMRPGRPGTCNRQIAEIAVLKSPSVLASPQRSTRFWNDVVKNAEATSPSPDPNFSSTAVLWLRVQPYLPPSPILSLFSLSPPPPPPLPFALRLPPLLQLLRRLLSPSLSASTHPSLVRFGGGKYPSRASRSAEERRGPPGPSIAATSWRSCGAASRSGRAGGGGQRPRPCPPHRA